MFLQVAARPVDVNLTIGTYTFALNEGFVQLSIGAGYNSSKLNPTTSVIQVPLSQLVWLERCHPP
jgi:hypothetical protein